jgi:hypothetical protein
MLRPILSMTAVSVKHRWHTTCCLFVLLKYFLSMIFEISRMVKIPFFWVWYHVIWPTYTVVSEDESRQLAEAAVTPRSRYIFVRQHGVSSRREQSLISGSWDMDYFLKLRESANYNLIWKAHKLLHITFTSWHLHCNLIFKLLFAQKYLKNVV